jgi:glycogen operon protein
MLSRANIAWHGVSLHRPDWGGHSHTLALTVQSRRARLVFHVMLNAFWEPLVFELPPADAGTGAPWRRWIDTALPSPEDITLWATAPLVTETTYRLQPRSTVVLARTLPAAGPGTP